MRVMMNDSESTRIEGKDRHCLGGQMYDIPDNVARVWIEKGIASAVAESPRAKKETDTTHERRSE